MNLNDLTSKLGRVYDGWKESEREKNALKDAFFEAASAEVAQEEPAQFVERVYAKDEGAARKVAEARWPHLDVEGLHPDNGGTWVVILRENPKYRSFTHINPVDGRVYSRQVVEGGPILDDEALREAEPKLWEAITEEITERRIKPMEQLTPEQMEALKPYIYSGKPTVKLAAPRKAKPEELDI